MRGIAGLIIIVSSMANMALGQETTVRFTAITTENRHYQIDSVKVTDMTQGWSMTLVYPDTILILKTSSNGIANNHRTEARLSAPYPNPSNGRVSLELTVPHQAEAQITLVGADGKVLESMGATLAAGSHQIRVSTKNKGVHYLYVALPEGRQVTKFVSLDKETSNSIEVAPTRSKETSEKGQNTELYERSDVMWYEGYATYQGMVVRSEVAVREGQEDETVTLLIHTDGGGSETGALTGLFSVSETRQVSFSQGNLQYSTIGSHQTADGTASGTWRFAATQYEYIGEGNEMIGEDYSGFIDLFGWGTSGWNSGAPAYEPYSVSETNTNYAPCGSAQMSLTGEAAKADWGVYNAISNGGNMPMLWRTLTSEEWQYLTDESNASRTGKTAEATITAGGTDYNGLLLLPDAFDLPAGCNYTAGFGNGYQTNQYDAEQWAAMEEAGAVFLTTAGRRNGTTMTHVNARGIYWSSSRMDESNAYTLFFVTGVIQSDAAEARRIGAAVRLVRDAE